MKWVLQRSFVSGAVFGARTREQLSDVVHASHVLTACNTGTRSYIDGCDDGELSKDILDEIDRIHERYPNPCP